MMPPVSLTRHLLASVCFLAATVTESPAGQATPAVANDAPLELPKLSVKDLRPLPPPESWRYAAVPGLEILSAASDRDTRNLLRDLQLFDAAVGVVWPALKTSRPLPLALILCAPDRDFASFVPQSEIQATAGKASVLLLGSDHAAIALNFAAKSVELDPADADPPRLSPMSAYSPLGLPTPTATVFDASRQVDFYQQLHREYIRYLLRRNQPSLPVWLEEGLARLLMGMRVSPRFIEFAKVEDPNLGPVGAIDPSEAGSAAGPGSPPTEERDFNGTLAVKGLIPLAEFFAVTRDSPAANNPLGGKWSKQAHALVHLWLYGEGRRYTQRFAKFALRASQEPVTEAMFRDCFQLSYAEMLAVLRTYVRNTAYVHQEFEAGKDGGLSEPVPLALRDATEPEVGRIKSEAQMLAGHLDAARDELLAPFARGKADGPLLASLGLFEQTRGETARARKFLEAAAKQQVVRPRAYLELASLRYTEAMAAAGSGLLNADQARSVVQPLLLARQQPPPLPEAYELMTDVWLHSSAAPEKSDLGAINQGVLLFQRRPVLLLQAAELNGKYGNPAEALAMANQGIRLSQTPEARAAFEEVKAALPPVPVK